MIYVENVDITNQPAGGVKQAHRLVQVLLELGHDAVLVNCFPSPFRIDWFENDVPTQWIAQVQFNEGDYLVVPEMIQMWPDIRTIHLATKVVYNQNYWFSFNIFCDWEHGMPVQYDRIRHFYCREVDYVLANSEYVQSFLEFMFPGMAVHRIRYSFDRKPFVYGEAKKRQLCYLPRRRRQESERLLEILRTNGALADWKVVPIAGMSEGQVAETMRESAIFLSMGYREGFGMPPMEAMACGCVVVGFAGNGGNEFFGHDFAVQAVEGDILDCGRKLMPFLRMDLRELNKLGRRAADFAVDEYSSDRERESIRLAFERMLPKLRERPQ